jgi:hypothetical protein
MMFTHAASVLEGHVRLLRGPDAMKQHSQIFVPRQLCSWRACRLWQPDESPTVEGMSLSLWAEYMVGTLDQQTS